MTILFYILVSLCLVIVKTTLIPALPMFNKFYDLLIPIIIYLSLFRPLREGIPIILFFGVIMDSLRAFTWPHISGSMPACDG